MFTGELAESRQTEIMIHDVDESAMELLIDYCYTSRIVVDEKNVQMLLPAACILQVSNEGRARFVHLTSVNFRLKKCK